MDAQQNALWLKARSPFPAGFGAESTVPSIRHVTTPLRSALTGLGQQRTSSPLTRTMQNSLSTETRSISVEHHHVLQQTRVASAQRDRAEKLERRQQNLHQAHEQKRTEHSQSLLRAELQRERLALGGVQPRAQSALPLNENAVTPLTLSTSVPVVARWADAGQYSPQSHLHTSVTQSNLFTGPPQLYPMKQILSLLAKQRHELHQHEQARGHLEHNHVIREPGHPQNRGTPMSGLQASSLGSVTFNSRVSDIPSGDLLKSNSAQSAAASTLPPDFDVNLDLEIDEDNVHSDVDEFDTEAGAGSQWLSHHKLESSRLAARLLSPLFQSTTNVDVSPGRTFFGSRPRTATTPSSKLYAQSRARLQPAVVQSDESTIPVPRASPTVRPVTSLSRSASAANFKSSALSSTLAHTDSSSNLGPRSTARRSSSFGRPLALRDEWMDRNVTIGMRWFDFFDAASELHTTSREEAVEVCNDCQKIGEFFLENRKIVASAPPLPQPVSSDVALTAPRPSLVLNPTQLMSLKQEWSCVNQLGRELIRQAGVECVARGQALYYLDEATVPNGSDRKSSLAGQNGSPSHRTGDVTGRGGDMFSQLLRQFASNERLLERTRTALIRAQWSIESLSQLLWHYKHLAALQNGFSLADIFLPAHEMVQHQVPIPTLDTRLLNPGEDDEDKDSPVTTLSVPLSTLFGSYGSTIFVNSNGDDNLSVNLSWPWLNDKRQWSWLSCLASLTHGFADSFQPLSPLDALPSHPHNAPNHSVANHVHTHDQNAAADPFIMTADMSTVVLVDSSWSQCPIDDVFALHRDIESMSRQPRLAIRRFTKFFAYQDVVLGTECRGRLSESGVITVSGGLGSLPKLRPSVDEGEPETAGVVAPGGILGAYLLGFVQCRNVKAALRVRQIMDGMRIERLVLRARLSALYPSTRVSIRGLCPVSLNNALLSTTARVQLLKKLQTRVYAVCAVFGTIRSVTAGPGGDELLVNFVKIEAAVRAVLSLHGRRVCEQWVFGINEFVRSEMQSFRLTSPDLSADLHLSVPLFPSTSIYSVAFVNPRDLSLSPEGDLTTSSMAEMTRRGEFVVYVAKEVDSDGTSNGLGDAGGTRADEDSEEPTEMELRLRGTNRSADDFIHRLEQQDRDEKSDEMRLDQRHPFKEEEEGVNPLDFSNDVAPSRGLVVPQANIGKPEPLSVVVVPCLAAITSVPAVVPLAAAPLMAETQQSSARAQPQLDTTAAIRERDEAKATIQLQLAELASLRTTLAAVQHELGVCLIVDDKRKEHIESLRHELSLAQAQTRNGLQFENQLSLPQDIRRRSRSNSPMPTSARSKSNSPMTLGILGPVVLGVSEEKIQQTENECKLLRKDRARYKLLYGIMRHRCMYYRELRRRAKLASASALAMSLGLDPLAPAIPQKSTPLRPNSPSTLFQLCNVPSYLVESEPLPREWVIQWMTRVFDERRVALLGIQGASSAVHSGKTPLGRSNSRAQLGSGTRVTALQRQQWTTLITQTCGQQTYRMMSDSCQNNAFQTRQLCHSLTRAVAHHGVGDDYLTRFQRFLDKTFNVTDFNDFILSPESSITFAPNLSGSTRSPRISLAQSNSTVSRPISVSRSASLRSVVSRSALRRPSSALGPVSIGGLADIANTPSVYCKDEIILESDEETPARRRQSAFSQFSLSNQTPLMDSVALASSLSAQLHLETGDRHPVQAFDRQQHQHRTSGSEAESADEAELWDTTTPHIYSDETIRRPGSAQRVSALTGLNVKQGQSATNRPGSTLAMRASPYSSAAGSAAEAVPARHFLMVNHAAQAAVDRRLRNSASAAALTNNGEGQRAIEDAIQKDNKRTISAYRHVQRPSSTRSELGGLRGGYMPMPSTPALHPSHAQSRGYALLANDVREHSL